jgi:UDP-glucose 4-epimerase
MTDRVLVTGGFGAIGGRLIERLAAEGRRVRVGARRAAPAWAAGVDTVPMDLGEPADWSRALDGVDAIVHLAALNDRDAKADPARARRVGVDGTAALLDQAVRHGVGRFVFMSTAHVYGTPYTGRIDESTPTAPVSAYAETHLDAERLVEAAHRDGSVVGVRLRCSNGFGRPASPDATIWQVVFNDLCRQAATTNALVLASPGLQQRNFIPFGEVTGAVSHVLGVPAGALGDGLFNLGSPRSMRILDVAHLVRDRARAVLGSEPSLHVPHATGPVDDRPVDFVIDKLSATGAPLRGDLESEVDDLLRWCAREFGGVRA